MCCVSSHIASDFKISSSHFKRFQQYSHIEINSVFSNLLWGNWSLENNIACTNNSSRVLKGLWPRPQNTQQWRKNRLKKHLWIYYFNVICHINWSRINVFRNSKHAYAYLLCYHLVPHKFINTDLNEVLGTSKVLGSLESLSF